MTVPSELVTSKAMQFITSRGWNWRSAGPPQYEIETCPYCDKDGYHFRMSLHGADDSQANRDGLCACMKCGKQGNLTSLKQHLGVTIPEVESRKDSGDTGRKTEELPDLEEAHQALLENANAMDYLMNGRGFSRAIIEQQKLGYTPERYFRETGKVPAIIYPYLVNSNSVFVHYRTCPDMDNPGKVPKAFSSPMGWTVPLYNQEALNKEGLKEIVMVEGEANCISAMDHAVIDICGVPGANFKKAEWIDVLDKLELEKIYICYDKDKVGQKAAQTLAAKIGIEKCWKITLPDFMVPKDDGTERLGKDLNEYFTFGGGTAESFAKLKEEAVLFDVDGVASSKDSLSEFMDELEGKSGLEPKYKSAWPSQNKLVGFDEGDVIDILAPEKVGKTTYAMNLMEHMCSTYGEDGVFICLEMTRARMARKWVSHKAGIEDNLPKDEAESHALLAKFKEAVPKLQKEVQDREGDFYFCYPQYKNCEDIYNLMRACIRRYGVKWIAIDNIQRLADTTPRGQGRNRTEHLSEISKVISQIAKDYGVQIIRILQPNRIQGGGMVSTDNVDGSSQIAKDCDCMLTLHRPRIANNNTADVMQFDSGAPMEEEATFSDRMLLTVGLSRYSSGGRCELHMNGATSTVSEMSEHQKKVIQAMANHNVGHAAQIQNQNLAGLKKAVEKTAPASVDATASETIAEEPKETEEIGI